MLGWETNKTWVLKRVRKKGYIILRQLLQESRETIMCMYVYICWGRGGELEEMLESTDETSGKLQSAQELKTTKFANHSFTILGRYSNCTLDLEWSIISIL